ncbi:YhdP family protein [Stutzerimonas tarimensis]|uniref:YhdP family protein n=1 Tax=Stutzerimonas tarimensis TaxID=1507735 RepID=UPI0036DA28DE
MCWVLALGVILLGCYVSLGRQLVPLLAEYRLEIQQQAERVLQVPVRIGRVEGQWSRFSPRLVVHDLTLGEGGDALQLERLTAVVDVVETLRSRQISLYALELEAPRLLLEEDAEGSWRLEGWAKAESPSPADPQPVLEGLQRLHRVSVRHGQVTLQPFEQSPRTLNYVDLQLTNSGPSMRLDGRGLLPDGQRLSLSGEARVEPARWWDAELEAFIDLPSSDWSGWWPQRWGGEWPVQRLQAGGRAWLDWDPQGLRRMVLDLQGPRLEAGLGEQPMLLEDVSLRLHLQRRPEGYETVLSNLAFNRDGQRWTLADIGIRQGRREDEAGVTWQLMTKRLELEPLLPLVEALAPLPDPLGAVLADLQPQGTLRNLTLSYEPQALAAQRLHYQANLERVGFSAREWIPGADRLSGSIRGDLGGGELRLNATDVGFHLAQLFPEPWRFEQAAGQLRWTLDEEAITLASPWVQASGEEGHFSGDFLIRLNRDPAREDYMDLRIGLRDGDARFTERFLPSRLTAMNPALVSWLQQAVRGGRVEQGFFTYQGALNPGFPPEARQISLYMKTSGAELAYLPGWPSLQEASGEVWVEGNRARVQVAQGRIFDTRVHDVTARIGAAEPGAPVRLQLDGELDGSLTDGLRLLHEAPLGLADDFAGWQAEGPASGRLALDMQLGGETRPQVVVDLATAGARLSIAEPALRFEQLSGEFRFDSQTGLSGSNWQAQSLGHRVVGRALATGTPARPSSRIEASGVMRWPALRQWLGVEQDLPLQGELPYQLRLTLAGSDSELQVDSSLIGLVIELPAPFGKAAGVRRDSSLRISLGGEERLYGFQHARLAAVAFASAPGDWRGGRGELRLGASNADLPVQPGWRVRGRLAEFDWNAWQAIVGAGSAGDAEPLGEAADLLRDLQIGIGRFEGFGARVEDLAVSLARQGPAWKAELSSQAVEGSILRPDAAGEPMQVELRRLRLSPAVTPEPGSVPASDPLADVDPTTLPALDLSIESLWRGDDPLGSVGLALRPVSGGAESQLDLNLKGLRIGGTLTWRNGRSAYRGRIEGDNIADVLVAWGFARSATSERFNLDVDGHWPGSPVWFSFLHFSGRLDPVLHNGQFVELEGSAQALRVFGLLNFDAIGRRLRLDFSDVLGRGLAYDRVTGQLQAERGLYRTEVPLVLKGPSSDLELRGTLDLAQDRIDAKLLVTLPLTNNLPIAALLAGAPAIGGAIWIADKLLGDRIARFASVQYDVQGPWQAPAITFDRPFESAR